MCLVEIPQNEIGGMLGILAAFLSGVNSIAPVLGGTIFQALGAPVPFLTGGVILAILLLTVLNFIKPGREEQAPAGLPHLLASINPDRSHPIFLARVALIVTTAVLTVGFLKEALQDIRQGYY